VGEMGGKDVLYFWKIMLAVRTEKFSDQCAFHTVIQKLAVSQWIYCVMKYDISRQLNCSIGRVSKQRLFIRDLLFIERFTFSGDDVASL